MFFAMNGRDEIDVMIRKYWAVPTREEQRLCLFLAPGY
jgi:hypothetical protein